MEAKESLDNLLFTNGSPSPVMTDLVWEWHNAEVLKVLDEVYHELEYYNTQSEALDSAFVTIEDIRARYSRKGGSD